MGAEVLKLADAVSNVGREGFMSEGFRINFRHTGTGL